jgi:hypothetical protein
VDRTLLVLATTFEGSPKMSRHRIARALLVVLAALIAWSTVTPADARPRRYADEVMADWTICRDGAELEIGSPSDRVRLIATSPRSSGGQRVLANVTLALPLRPLTIWIEWPIPTDSSEVIDETPDEEAPQINDQADPPVSAHSAIVKVWWSHPAGSTVRLALGPTSDPSPPAATYRVRDCRFRHKRTEHRALRSSLWNPSWLFAGG